MKKKIFTRFGILSVFALLSLFFAGCDNLTDYKTDENAKAYANAYLTLSANETSARTALPVIEASGFESYTLAGTLNGGTSQTLGEWNAYSDLAAAKVGVEAGNWVFTLTAKKGGTSCTGSLSKEISSGGNALSFTLSLDSLSTSGTGSVEFTITLGENHGVVAATAAIESGAAENATVSGNTVSYKKSSVSSGNYKVTFTLYADSGKTLPLAKVVEYAAVTDGLASVSSFTVSSVDKKQTVTFNANGGTFTSGSGTSKAVPYTRLGEAVSLPTSSEVTRTGYIFAGWFTASSGGDKVTEITAGTGTTELFAHWNAGTVNYTVKHYQQNLSDDGYTLFETENKTGTTGTQTAATAKTYTGFTALGTITQKTIAADGTTTVEIKYTRNAYTVTFNADGGSAVASQSVKYGGKATAPAEPTKDGYTFDGWYNGNTAFDFDTAITGNITLTAKWSEAGPKVGDIVLSDGTIIKAAKASEMTSEQKEKAVAVIFYVGGDESDLLGARTLGVGLKNTQQDENTTLQWRVKDGLMANITAIQCTPSATGAGAAATATFTGDINGSDNWTVLIAAKNGNYPAWEWVNDYASANSLTGTYASGWYLPTVAELSALYRVKDTVDTSLAAAGGTEIAKEIYWSSSQAADNRSYAWKVWFSDGTPESADIYTKGSVCCIRAF